MAHLQLLRFRPRPGDASDVRHLLRELDGELAVGSGLIFSLIVGRKPGPIGRVVLWRDRNDSDREAGTERTLNILSRLRHWSSKSEERTLEVESGSLHEGNHRAFPPRQHAGALPHRLQAASPARRLTSLPGLSLGCCCSADVPDGIKGIKRRRSTGVT